jgi:rhodanese-related sulfurtransferase
MTKTLEVSCTDVKARLDRGDKFLLLDCREQDEHELAAIAGARLVPMSELVARVRELDEWQQGEIVVHCHKGIRSLRVANWLREQGFENVHSMAGGIDAWSQEIDSKVPRY